MAEAPAVFVPDKARSLKEWEDKYRYFSHTAQDRRTKQQCRFFPDKKSKEKYAQYAIGQAAPMKHGTEASEPEFEVVRDGRPIQTGFYSDDRLTARMKECLEYAQMISPEFNSPMHSKYKYFSGGGGVAHIEAHRKGADTLMEWKRKKAASTAASTRPNTVATSASGGRSTAVDYLMTQDDEDSFVSLSKEVFV